MIRRLLLGLVSVIVTLLVIRMITLLMAGDPNHPFVQILRWLTDPLLGPVAWIDANQPLIGSRFERGTLFLAGALVLLTLVGLRVTRKAALRGRFS